MFAGHVGAGLAIGRAERRVNVGVFVALALLLDLVLWVAVLSGWESVAIPPDFTQTHQPEFVFPYSHGLLASVGWSLLAAAATFAFCRIDGANRWRAAALAGAAVFSHWLLDALVHRPEMPVLTESSMKVGLGLWGNLAVGLAIEGVIVLAGVWLFLSGSGLSRGRAIAIGVFAAVLLTFTVVGMTLAPAPPSGRSMAGGSLVTLMIVCVLAWFLGRRQSAES